MKINKYIKSAFPGWSSSFNSLVTIDFVNVIMEVLPEYQEEIKQTVGIDFKEGLNSFFINNSFTIKDGSLFGKVIRPTKLRLNDRMWWFASGWLRCRNQILTGSSSNFAYSKSDQTRFIGLIEPQGVTISRMRNFLKTVDVTLSDEVLKSFHQDIVAHYLLNQNVIIGDE